MKTITAGSATNNGYDGADFYLLYHGKLPNYYISSECARELGWRPYLGNLFLVAPDKMLSNGIYQNREGKLPSSPGRIWYEVDINYTKKIPEGPVILDFNGCKYLGELHQALKQQLGLPDYYGENWDALWDCLRDFRDYPITIKVYGTKSLPQTLHAEVLKMLEVFDAINDHSSNIHIVLNFEE